MKNLQIYESFAIEFGRYAGRKIRQGFNNNIDVKVKKDATVVTELDISLNRELIERVQKLFPETGVLGEELQTDNYHEKDMLWVCDPIDGTLPFTKRLQISSFSIALLRRGEPILGVVVDPYLDEVYHAVKNQGAYLEGEKMKVSGDKDISHQMIPVTGSYKIGLLAYEIAKLDGYAPTYNSFIFGGKKVASGDFVGAVFAWTSPWDCAALKIITEEAGGKVTNLEGEKQDYDGDINGCVFSNGVVHDMILELIKKSGLKIEKDRRPQ